MIDFLQLAEKLRKLQALYEGAASDGERTAAAEAIDRVKQRAKQQQAIDPPVEFSFAMQNVWSHRLFIALLRRYGIAPYRYRRQRRTTVMARVSRSFVQETLWPEFQAIDAELSRFLSEITDRIIRENVFADIADAEVRDGAPMAALSEVAAPDAP
jgi:hypothetical protein